MMRGNGTSAIGGEGAPEGLLSTPTSRGRDAKQELIERARAMPAQLNEVNEQFIGFVREQPLVALGAACALGYVLGRVLRRVV